MLSKTTNRNAFKESVYTSQIWQLSKCITEQNRPEGSVHTLGKCVMLAVLTQGKCTNGSISLFPHFSTSLWILGPCGGREACVDDSLSLSCSTASRNAVNCVYLVAWSCLSLLSMLRSSDTGNFPWFLLFLPSFFICFLLLLLIGHNS